MTKRRIKKSKNRRYKTRGLYRSLKSNYLSKKRKRSKRFKKHRNMYGGTTDIDVCLMTYNILSQQYVPKMFTDKPMINELKGELGRLHRDIRYPKIMEQIMNQELVLLQEVEPYFYTEYLKKHSHLDSEFAFECLESDVRWKNLNWKENGKEKKN